jgi:hypothetical protein
VAANFSILLPIIGGLLVVVGAFWVKRGRWPRRVGDTPHCRKCDYILSGDQARCPECGTVVQPSTIVRGERNRRTGLTLLGGGLAFFGLAIFVFFAIGVASSMPWLRLEPLGWLLSDLGGNSSRSSTAWREIQRRIDGNLLSEDQQNAVVERGLKLQAAGTAPSGGMTNILDFVARRYLDHKLSSEQADRFFANALKVKLTARPVIGTQSMVSYSLGWSGGQGPGAWTMRMRMLHAQVDDGPLQPLGATIGTGFSGAWSGGGALPPVPTPGKHRLHVKVELSVDVANASFNSNVPAIQRSTQDLVADFQVISGPTQITTTTVPDASVLRPLFTPKVTRSSVNPHWLDIDIRAAAPPVDVAFDVFIRCDGKEYPAGAINFHKGGEGNFGITATDFPTTAPPSVDVILRTDEAVAASTLDMTQIWKGEIVLQNVPLRRTPAMPHAPAPAGTQPGPAAGAPQ